MSIVAARLSAYADLGDAWLCDFRDERNERPVTRYTGQSIRKAPPSPMGRGRVETRSEPLTRVPGGRSRRRCERECRIGLWPAWA